MFSKPFVCNKPIHTGLLLVGSESADEGESLNAVKKKRMVWLNRTLPIVLIVGCLLAIRYGKQDLVRLRDDYGAAAFLVSIPMQAVISASPMPADALCVTYGAMYYYPVAVLLSWVGWFLGAILEFQVVRSLSRLERFDRMAENAPSWLTRFPAESPWFLILGRQVPGVGAHATIVAAAVAGVGYSRFLCCSAIAIIPGALLFPAIGAQLF